jgi:hypothetical protein
MHKKKIYQKTKDVNILIVQNLYNDSELPLLDASVSNEKIGGLPIRLNA